MLRSKDKKCCTAFNQRFELGSCSKGLNPARACLTPHELAAMDRTSWRMSRTSGSPVYSCYPGNPYPDPKLSSNSALSHAIYGEPPRPPIKSIPRVTVVNKTICIPLKRPGVKIGCQPITYNTKKIDHLFTWNNDIIPSKKCPLWHCQLPRTRDNNERPW